MYLRGDKSIEDYWYATFLKSEHEILDTQSVHEFDDTIDHYIYINAQENIFAEFYTTKDSVLLMAYSDDVTTDTLSNDEYEHTIYVGTHDTIYLRTDRSTNKFGSPGSYSYKLTFKEGPTTLENLIGSQVGGSDIPWEDLWCDYLCCPTCKETHDILDIEEVDFVCCFYCSLCHCC